MTTRFADEPDDALPRAARVAIAVAAAASLALAIAAFHHVELSGGARLDGAAAVYAAIRLFLLDNDGYPARGSDGWVALLWALYFAAPALTGATAYNYVRALWRDLGGPERRARRLRGHVIVAGHGKHASALLASLDGVATDVVIIDDSGQLGDWYHGRWPVVRGDPTLRTTLEAAGVHAARRVVAAGDDGFRNITACSVALELAASRGLRAVAVVTDPDFWEATTDSTTAGAALGDIRLINPYERAAAALTPPAPVLVIAGFGALGRAVVLAHGVGEARTLQRVVLLDRAADRKCRHMQRAYGDRGLCELIAVQGDIADPDVFAAAIAHTGEAEPTVLLCTDDDAANIERALLFRDRWRFGANVIVRVADTRHVQAFLESRGIRPIALSRLIARSDLGRLVLDDAPRGAARAADAASPPT